MPVDSNSVVESYEVCNHGLCLRPRVIGTRYCDQHQERSILADAMLRADLNSPEKMAPHDRSHELNKGAKGVKYDKGKAKVMQGVFQYFSRALEEVSRVSEFGAEKYSWGGFSTVPDAVTRYSNAMARHILEEGRKGPRNVEDGGVLYAAQIAWNALARLEMMLRDEEARQKTGDANGIGQPPR